VHEVATARETNPDDRVSKLEAELAKLRGDYSRLHHMYTRTLEELELVRRRMFIAKAERVDTSADQLAFHGMFDQIEGLRKALEIIDAANGNNPGGKPDGRKKKKHRPTGRRDLSKTPLPVQRVEVVDPMLEGVAKRIGVEESQRVVFRRGGRVRLVIARVVYKRFGDPCCAAAPRAFLTMLIVARSGHREVCFVPSNSKATGIVAAGDLCQTSPAVCVPPRGAKAAPKSFQIVTAAMPKELFPRGLLAPSMIAHVLFEKYVMGVPFYRQE